MEVKDDLSQGLAEVTESINKINSELKNLAEHVNTSLLLVQANIDDHNENTQNLVKIIISVPTFS